MERFDETRVNTRPNKNMGKSVFDQAYNKIFLWKTEPEKALNELSKLNPDLPNSIENIINYGLATIPEHLK